MIQEKIVNVLVNQIVRKRPARCLPLPGYFLIAVSFFSCVQETWYRSESGLQYRVIQSHEKNAATQMGCVVKLQISQRLNDSTLISKNAAPRYEIIVPGVVMPYSYTEPMVYGLHEDDSILVVQRVDSMIAKKCWTKKPDWSDADDQIITTIKILRVFLPDPAHPGKMDSLVNADKTK